MSKANANDAVARAKAAEKARQQEQAKAKAEAKARAAQEAKAMANMAAKAKAEAQAAAKADATAQMQAKQAAQAFLKADAKAKAAAASQSPEAAQLAAAAQKYADAAAQAKEKAAATAAAAAAAADKANAAAETARRAKANIAVAGGAEPKKPVSYETKKRYIGYAFIAIWIFGFLYLTVLPMANTVIFSLSEVKPEFGYFDTTFIGFKNYETVLINDSTFLPALTETFSSVIVQTPLLVVFSLIMAMMLNQEFKGRTVFRAIFFLPVIIAGSLVMDAITGSQLMGAVMEGEVGNGGLFQSDFISEILTKTNLPADLVNQINTLVNDIFNLTWQSGIQILIFLAALQSVEGTLYEVAKVEGATAWETFWKVTFPMIIPMLVLNLLYTFIDNYTSYSSAVFKLVADKQEAVQLATASTMSIINFIVVFVVVILIYAIASRKMKD